MGARVKREHAKIRRGARPGGAVCAHGSDARGRTTTERGDVVSLLHSNIRYPVYISVHSR